MVVRDRLSIDVYYLWISNRFLTMTISVLIIIIIIMVIFKCYFSGELIALS